jgi:hypothetical protein
MCGKVQEQQAIHLSKALLHKVPVCLMFKNVSKLARKVRYATQFDDEKKFLMRNFHRLII